MVATTSNPDAAPALSSRDLELLRAMDDPASLDPGEYAQWRRRPEIQDILDARRELNERALQARADATVRRTPIA